jgi:hypothetical protein
MGHHYAALNFYSACLGDGGLGWPYTRELDK